MKFSAGTREALERCQPELTVLLHIARCDNLFHQKERDQIDDYVAKQCFDLEFDPVELYRHICKRTPSQDEFFDALSELKNSPSQRRTRFLQTCERLIAADEVIASEEVDCLQTIKHALT